MILYLYIIVIHMVYCPGRLHIVYILSITHITIINMYSKICIPVFFNHLHRHSQHHCTLCGTQLSLPSHLCTILQYTNIAIYTLFWEEKINNKTVVSVQYTHNHNSALLYEEKYQMCI